ncbi:hypothetical protein BJ138DRAFT_1018573, partial [Hygrophoropsis aurantiaca]
MRLIESTNDGPSLREYIEETEGFLKDVQLGYPVDKTLSKVLDKPSEHAAFALRDGLLYSKNHGGEEVLCIPRAVSKGKSIPGIIIEQAHMVLGHFGPNKTADYIRRWYWW